MWKMRLNAWSTNHHNHASKRASPEISFPTNDGFGNAWARRQQKSESGTSTSVRRRARGYDLEGRQINGALPHSCASHAIYPKPRKAQKTLSIVVASKRHVRVPFPRLRPAPGRTPTARRRRWSRSRLRNSESTSSFPIADHRRQTFCRSAAVESSARPRGMHEHAATSTGKACFVYAQALVLFRPGFSAWRATTTGVAREGPRRDTPPKISRISCRFVLWAALNQTKYCCSLKVKAFGGPPTFWAGCATGHDVTFCAQNVSRWSDK